MCTFDLNLHFHLFVRSFFRTSVYLFLGPYCKLRILVFSPLIYGPSANKSTRKKTRIRNFSTGRENEVSKRYFCLVCQQLIKDMVSIGETTNWLTRRSVYSKYRSLKCHIESLEHGSDEFGKIQEYVNSSETR